MLHILSSIVVGFLVGLVARGLTPGVQHMGFWATVLVGIVGSVVGGLIARIFSRPADGALFHPAGFVLSVLGGIVTLLVLSHYYAA